jgi:D-mannonate dehydratase
VTLADRMAALLTERPRTFYELLRELGDVEYRAILQAWGALRECGALARDDHGRYLMRG